MGKMVRTAKGEMLDFDRLHIKQQIAARPPSSEVRARQDFIEKKIHRRAKKTYPKATVAPVTVEPTLPGADTMDTVAEPVVQQPVDAVKVKQKARPK